MTSENIQYPMVFGRLKDAYHVMNLAEIDGASVSDLVAFCEAHSLDPAKTSVYGLYGEPTVLEAEELPDEKRPVPAPEPSSAPAKEWWVSQATWALHQAALEMNRDPRDREA